MNQIEKEIDIILKTLWELRKEGEYYFKTYGKFMIEELIKKQCNK